MSIGEGPGKTRAAKALRLIVEAAAGLCAGAFLYHWVFNLPAQSVMPGGTSVGRLVPLASIALVAAAIAILVRPKRLGWAVTAVAPVVVVLTLPASFMLRFEALATVWGICIAAGLALGGVALAAANAAVPERVALACGFATGVASGSPVLGVILPADHLDREAFLSATRWYGIVLAAVFAVAALVALLDRRDTAPEPRRVGFVVCGALGGLLFVAAHDALGAAPSSMDGLLRRDPYPYTGLVLVIGTWYAYRRGGSVAARWIVLALGIAVPAVMGPSLRADIRPPAELIVVAVLAAAVGTALSVRADRLAPWDALGVLAAAAGWLLGSPYLLHRDAGSEPAAAYLVTAGTVFALAAGTTRLLRSKVDDIAALTAAGLGVKAGWVVRYLDGLAQNGPRARGACWDESVKAMFPGITGFAESTG